ncbi:MAG TPA: methyltransferase domain-containing protein, partial [Armatimonadota bacterium]|nr:methyltransferase domain-containing protein [Armatimonadota bacterium]
MVAEPLVRVQCAVCAGEERELLCSAAEVCVQLEYLHRFHRRRLRATAAHTLADRADFTQDYATDIVACAACGLVFRSPRPPDDAIARAYAQDQYGRERLDALFEAQVELYRPKARALRRRLPAGARVIEVGSFVGGFLAAGREQGWEMLGVDPGREVDTFCAERGLPVFSGTLPQLGSEQLPVGWQPGSVDCVAVWNAFDQLPHPEPTLRAARRLLRPGGLLALRVPNGECFRLATRRMRQLPKPAAGWLRALLAWNNLLAFPYLYGYSVRTLDWLLSWPGFRRVDRRADTLCRLSDELTRPWAA